jgi:glucan phosphoethanolaminetransferase (alkaline phosphatase superfamily)
MLSPSRSSPGAESWDRRRRVWLLAIALAIAVPLYDTWALGLSYRSFFGLSHFFQNPPAYLLRMAGFATVLATAVLAFRAALLSPAWWRLVCATVIGLTTFIEYGYVASSGSPMNSDDIRIAFENVFFWKGEIRTFTNWWAVGPMIAFGVTCLAVKPAARGYIRRAAVALLAVFFVHSLWAGRAYLRRDQTIGVSEAALSPVGMPEEFARTVTLTGWRAVAESVRYERRQTLPYRADTAPDYHVVLVIDESISAGHMSLNGYRRSTTPWLEELVRSGRAANWGVAAAAANYSDASVYCLLTGVTVLPDRARLGFVQPTLFQFARAMNFGTHLFEGQVTRRRFGLSAADMALVDDSRNSAHFGNDYDTDMRMARAVKDTLKAPTGQFVVVLKRGNHVPQEDNYPAGHGMWEPANDGAVPKDAREAAITNTYDDGVAYNVDGFFRTLLDKDGSLARTVVLYTSDHGEVLAGEGAAPFTRALDWSVLAVPMMMMGDARPSVDTAYRASHHNVFATVLDLLRFPRTERPATYGRSLLAARSSDDDRRTVFTGALFGDGHYEIGDFDTLRRPAVLR